MSRSARVGGCGDVAPALSGSCDGEALDARADRHVGTCLRCQAELVQYRKLAAALHRLRGEPAGSGSHRDRLAEEVLSALGDGEAPRQPRGTLRPSLVGLAGAAAVSAGAVAVVRRHAGEARRCVRGGESGRAGYRGRQRKGQ